MRKGTTPRLHFTSKKDVRRRRQVVAQRQILVDDLDPVLARLDGAVHHDLFAVHQDRARTGPEVPGDHRGERGLFRAIVAHQTDHLAGLKREGHVPYGFDGPEMLGHMLELQNRHQVSSPPIKLKSPAFYRFPGTALGTGKTVKARAAAFQKRRHSG